MRWDVVFGGNFGSGAGIILRLVLVWLIRHSTGPGGVLIQYHYSAGAIIIRFVLLLAKKKEAFEIT